MESRVGKEKFKDNYGKDKAYGKWKDMAWGALMWKQASVYVGKTATKKG